MIVGLCNSRWKYFRIDNWDWFRLLSLASAYGWRPLGALQPDGYRSIRGWDDENYFIKDEIVTDEDALRIAAAIHIAILDIKDSVLQKENEKKRIEHRFMNLFGNYPQELAEIIKTEECRALQLGFNRDDVHWLKEFAKFCLQGKYKII